MGKVYKVFGIFYLRNSFEHRATKNFTSEIRVEENGTFKEAITKDEYGISIIEGILDNPNLKFTKTYQEGSKGGSDVPIHYNLHNQGFGFVGTWEYDKEAKRKKLNYIKDYEPDVFRNMDITDIDDYVENLGKGLAICVLVERLEDLYKEIIKK